jgi:hypothetical protein
LDSLKLGANFAGRLIHCSSTPDKPFNDKA